ncbi:MAG: hypothetical protein ACM3JG_17900 [Thiohalocapsa sp.]
MRNSASPEYGCYRVCDGNEVIDGYMPYSFSLTLDDVEALVARGVKSR